MKRLLAALCLLPAIALADKPDAWYNPAPEGLLRATPHAELPAARFFEVAASRLDAAESDLASQPLLAQVAATLDYWGQRNFACPAASHPYLVRALYQNGGTGAFSVARYGNALLVAHGALGAPSVMRRTALVVCLDFEPAHVYHGLSGAL